MFYNEHSNQIVNPVISQIHFVIDKYIPTKLHRLFENNWRAMNIEPCPSGRKNVPL